MRLFALAATFLLVAACVESGPLDPPDSGAGGGLGHGGGAGSAGKDGEGGQGGSPGSGGVGGIADTCPEIAKSVYVVDNTNGFSRFDPLTLKFTELFTLACPAKDSASPFSMAVDRDGIAWVLYSSGELFRVDIEKGDCVPTAYDANATGFRVFGMGFSRDVPRGEAETLFIAGSDPKDGELGDATLAVLRLQDLSVEVRGQLTGSPEFTGTADARLWAFFPNVAAPSIAELDKETGATLRSIALESLPTPPRAWAFAFWGGSFWVFHAERNALNSSVYRVDLADGTMARVIENTGNVLVGAGVSTCAPLVFE